jgi:hypothetical protein
VVSLADSPRSRRCGVWTAVLTSSQVGPQLLYSSLADARHRDIASQAVVAAIGDRVGFWTFCLVDPPRQPLCIIIVIDGPNGFSGAWCFDHEDLTVVTVRVAIDAGLPNAKD